MSTVNEKVILPSAGMLDGVPGEVVIRAMKTSEEKLLMGSTGDSGLDAVIKSCIIEPKDFDFDALTIADKYYLFQNNHLYLIINPKIRPNITSIPITNNRLILLA